MDCSEIKKLIVERIDGSLDKDLSFQVDKHLELCQSCQEEYIQTGNLLKSMSGLEDEQPGESLREGFYNILDQETQKLINEEENENISLIRKREVWKLLRYAAMVLIIFSVGFVAGNYFTPKPGNGEEITALKEELSMLKQNTSLMSLNKPTASERLKAINTVSKSNNDNQELIGVLVNTLNSDDNVNVRMAAAYALAKFPDNEYVKISLIHSLEIQTEPIIQISLIGILIDFKDNRAKPVIEKLIENEKVLPEVKQQALIGLSVFV